MSSSRTQNIIRSRNLNINNCNSLKYLTAIAYTLCQVQLFMIFEIVKSNKKVELAKELIEKLDDLYDDLTYDNDEKETESIKAKIKLREEMLKQLGSL